MSSDGSEVAAGCQTVRRDRWGLALVAGFSTALLYADGVLKSGWIEAMLLAPVIWFMIVPRPAALLKNLLVSLLAICVTIVLCDLALRPVLDRRLNYTPLNAYAHKLPRLPIVGRWDPNLRLEDELYGDLAAVAGDSRLREPRRIAFNTDEAGFRNDLVPDQIDVLVLGDSFGAGWGTTQDRIFAKLLDTRYGWRTYNLSYPGGPYDQFVNFAIEWPRLHLSPESRLVWTFYTGNDLDDAGGATWDIDALPWKSVLGAWGVRYRTFRNRSPLNRLMENLRLGYLDSHGDQHSVIVRTLPDGQPIMFHSAHEAWGVRAKAEVERHPNFANLQRTLAAMRELVERRGIQLTVFVLPTKGEVYRWVLEQRMPKPDDGASSGFAQAVLGACEQAHLHCLDTKSYLVEEARRLFEDSRELLWWRDDTHLGERGHEALAAFIAREAWTLAK